MTDINLIIVDFETAELAYQLGFNEITDYVFTISEIGHLVKFNKNEKTSLFGYDLYPAPYLHQLQTWLRKNTQVEVIIIRCYEPIKTYTYEICIENNGFLKVDAVPETFSTYEESLKAGLKRAVSLINNI